MQRGAPQGRDATHDPPGQQDADEERDGEPHEHGHDEALRDDRHGGALVSEALVENNGQPATVGVDGGGGARLAVALAGDRLHRPVARDRTLGVVEGLVEVGVGRRQDRPAGVDDEGLGSGPPRQRARPAREHGRAGADALGMDPGQQPLSAGERRGELAQLVVAQAVLQRGEQRHRGRRARDQDGEGDGGDDAGAQPQARRPAHGQGRCRR